MHGEVIEICEAARRGAELRAIEVEVDGRWDARARNRQVQSRRAEIVCVSCRFGAVVATPPTRCPMCGGGTWRELRQASLDTATRPIQRPPRLSGRLERSR